MVKWLGNSIIGVLILVEGLPGLATEYFFKDSSEKILNVVIPRDHLEIYSNIHHSTIEQNKIQQHR